ncbi:MAG: hypothetical protein ACRDPW_03530 [Mycobacteriales bacterium]
MEALNIFGLAVGGALPPLIAFYFERRATRTQERKARARSTTETKLDTATFALQQSSRLVSEVEAELKLRMITVEKLTQEAQQAEQLAQLNEQQRRAVQGLVEAASIKGSKQGQWRFYVAGLVSAIPLGLIGDFLYDLVR